MSAAYDRRRYPRLPVELIVGVRKRPSLSASKQVIQNISEGGVAIKVSGKFHPHHLIHLEVVFPDTEEVLDILSIIRWSQDNMIGVEFLSISAGNKTAIRNFLKMKRDIESEDAM